MSEGQRAYEDELKIVPNYHDGTPRPQWSELCDVAKWSWERNPAPRVKTVQIFKRFEQEQHVQTLIEGMTQ